MQILTFSLDRHQFGVELKSVAEVVRAVAVARLPGAPEVVEGVIDVRGEVVPVLNTRRRFGLAARPVEPADMFILTEHQPVRGALHVDGVGWPIEVDRSELAAVPALAGDSPYVEGVLRTPEGVVVIHDVAKFLSGAEAGQLKRALHDLPRSRD